MKKPKNQLFWSLDAAQVGWAGAHPTWAVSRLQNNCFFGFFMVFWSFLVSFGFFWFFQWFLGVYVCFIGFLKVFLVFEWIGWQAGWFGGSATGAKTRNHWFDKPGNHLLNV